MHIDYGVSWTDHRPLHVEIDIATLTTHNVTTGKPNQWRPRSNLKISHYSEICERILGNYTGCTDYMNGQSASSIDNLCEIIVNTLQYATVTAFKKKSLPGKRTVLGWNKYVAESYAASRQALIL